MAVLVVHGCNRAKHVDSEVCGNGVLDSEEACDDLNRDPNDGCSAECKIEDGWSCTGVPSVCEVMCGNGNTDVGEECDDENLTNGDGCSAACTVEDGWICQESPDGASECELLCGNGVLDEEEDCDDGNRETNDGCNASCQQEQGWFCTTEPGQSSVCILLCGNGRLDAVANENCDDNNQVSGDGCDISCRTENGWYCENPDGLDNPSVCTTRCGDGIVAGLEECDDMNNNLNDLCPDGEGGLCKWAACGDGFVWDQDGGTETCDDGNTDDCEGSCRGDCETTTGCGDEVVCGDEVCDDGNVEDCQGDCSADCMLPVLYTCGDGVICDAEECDDGEANDDSLPDACRTDCRLPSCGDGVCDSADANWACPEDCREVVFFEDFEGDWPGDWQTGDNNPTNNVDTWGQSSARAHDGTYSCYCAEDGWTTIGYDDHMDAWATIPVDLSSTAGYGVQVTLWVWHQMNDPDDYFALMYSLNSGSEWTSIENLTGEVSTFIYKSYDFSFAAGNSDFWIGFYFFSDGMDSNLEGAYVDDLVIYRVQ
jgi:cysteine-rich repeat protein